MGVRNYRYFYVMLSCYAVMLWDLSYIIPLSMTDAAVRQFKQDPGLVDLVRSFSILLTSHISLITFHFFHKIFI